ncbi:MAG: type IV pilin protein [Chromatiales bacterium]|nr:type IV pilin protein [Chromatiales bacterium]
MQRSHRVDAERALIESAQALERYYTQNNTYMGFSVSDLQQTARYTITFDTGQPTATTFVLTATAGAAQAGEPCGNLKLRHTDKPTSTGGGQGCWPLEAP